MSFHPYLVFVAVPFFEWCVWLYPVPWALKQQRKVLKRIFPPELLHRNLPSSKTSPLLLRVPGFDAKLGFE